MKKNTTFKLDEQETELIKRYARMLGCSQAEVIGKSLQIMDTALREHRKVRYGAYSSDPEKQKVISFDFLDSTLHLLHVTDAIQN